MNSWPIHRVRSLLKKARPARAVSGGQHTPNMLPFLPSLLVVLVLAGGVAWLTFVGFARLGGFDLSPWRPVLGVVPAARLFDITRATATGVGVLAGVFAIVYAYRRQRIQEAESRRGDAEQLSQRYQDAAGQLGHDKAAVRLAGVYAMSRLADDWADQRQQCVDVLCAYVRLPIPKKGDHDEEVIRRTILDEILAHAAVRRDPSQSWSLLRLDLSAARISSFNATECHFENLSMRNAEVRGAVHFSNSSIGRILDLRGVQIYGSVSVAVSNREGYVDAHASRVHAGGGLYMSTTVGDPDHNDFAACYFDSVTVDDGGKLFVELSPGARRGAFVLSRASVSGELRILGAGWDCAAKSIATEGLETLNSGSVIVQQELLDKPELFSHGIRDTGPGPLNLKTVKVGPTRVLNLDD